MNRSKYIRLAHGVRWSLELLIIWALVLPETGIWTATVLTLMTAGIEFDHLDPRDWAKR